MIMKTRNIALTLFAGVALLVTSCVNEREFGFGEVGKDEVAFVLGGVQTKAVATEDFFIAPETVASFKVGNGERVVLEETVESLYSGPATKGTPAFTGNVHKLYKSFNAVANPNDAAKKLDDANFPFNEGTSFWSHAYPNQGIWDKAPLTFYMRMPASPAGVTSAYTYNGDGSIEFNYTSPENAAGQQDILFTSTTIQDENDNPKSVTFWHALTGIKFSNFYTNKEMDDRTVAKTRIKEVTLSGMKNSGHCKVESDGTVTWTNVSGNANFTLSHNDTTNYTNSGYGLDTLLNKNATARNINDADGSLTFWVVPQEFADSTVMIKVKFDIELVGKDENGVAFERVTKQDTTITVSLGRRAWTAGQLHTFTLKPIVVGVELEDKMSSDSLVKSNVRVDNTGNVYEYVRVNMIANWVGYVQTAENVYDEEDEVVLMGYTTGDDDNDTEVEFWNDKDGKTNYGIFTNLTPQSHQVPATADSTINNWVRYDKYYYYTLPIGPDDAITDQLFEKYEVGPSPEFWIADKWGVRRKAKNVHLIMDLMVQAIPAEVDEDGNVLDDYISAWVKALDKVNEPDDLLDL